MWVGVGDHVWSDIRCVATDGAGCFASVIETALPQVAHLRCRFHLRQNINKHVRSKLRGERWVAFNRLYHQCLHEPSLTVFEHLWARLMETYPESAAYMSEHVYPFRSHWASCWTNQYVTMGAHSTQRVESMNSLVKTICRPSFPLTDLFSAVTAISREQSEALIASLSDNRFTYPDYEGPLYNDARKVLTKQAAALVHIEGSYRENYSVRWMDRQPGIDWTSDTSVVDMDNCVPLHFTVPTVVPSIIHSSIPSDVHSTVTVYCTTAVFLQRPLTEALEDAVGGWLVTVVPSRRGTRTHLPHWVCVSGKHGTCTNCHFATVYLLPCRHILAVNLKVWPGQAFQVSQCHPRWLLDNDDLRPSHVSTAAEEEKSLSPTDGAMRFDSQSVDDNHTFEPSHDQNHNDLMAATERLSRIMHGHPRSEWDKVIAVIRQEGSIRGGTVSVNRAHKIAAVRIIYTSSYISPYIQHCTRRYTVSCRCSSDCYDLSVCSHLYPAKQRTRPGCSQRSCCSQSWGQALMQRYNTQ